MATSAAHAPSRPVHRDSLWMRVTGFFAVWFILGLFALDAVIKIYFGYYEDPPEGYRSERFKLGRRKIWLAPAEIIPISLVLLYRFWSQPAWLEVAVIATGIGFVISLLIRLHEATR